MGLDSWRGMNLRTAREAGRAVHFLAALLGAPWALLDCCAARAGADKPTRAERSRARQPVDVSVAHGPQYPASVPALPGYFVGKQVFSGPLVGRPKPGEAYQRSEGDRFAIHNGPGIHHFTLTSGMWWLRVGDRSRLAMDVRSGAAAYAQPALLPDLGVSARVRAAVTARGKTKWLDEFASIDVPAAQTHRFEVRLASETPKVEASLRVVVGAKSCFPVHHAAVAAVHDPQEVADDVAITPTAANGSIR